MARRVGFDFDSVITDSRKLKSAYTQEHYGITVPWQMFKRETVVPCGLLRPEVYQAASRAVYESHTCNSNMEEVPGAVDGIKKLLSEGLEVEVVTKRSGLALEYATNWLARRGLNIPITGVGHTNTKTHACEGIDMFVDDDVDNLVSLVDTVPRRYLYSWEFNMHKDIPRDIAGRVWDWNMIYALARTREQ